MANIRTIVAVTASILLALSTGAQADQPAYSRLWGEAGERWSPDSRLPDFSYAGYHRGEKPLPKVTPQVSVRDFGAVGDGKTDDTAAFRRAISEAGGRVIGVPAGRYVITDFVTIEKSGTVLLGEGPDRSVLCFAKSLEQVKPNPGFTTTGRPTTNYSWSGGFLVVRGRLSSDVLSEVIAPAKRGQTVLAVDHADRFRVGQDIRLSMRDTNDNSMARHFYAGDAGPVDNLNGRLNATFIARVSEVEPEGGTVELDRPLRTDVELRWRPRIGPAQASVEEVGIEGLGFDFPVTPYRGHFTEVGFNAIALSNVRNCWVRDVVIRHCDSGIFVQADNVTLAGVTFVSDRQPDAGLKATGHHGVTLGETDCLLTGFEFRTRFVHDITVTGGSAGNVVMHGSGVDLALDHHRYGPHANLWTDLDAGAGTRLFRSGGGAKLGWHCGAWETFWNIRARQSQRWPGSAGSERQWSCDLINLVGLYTDEPTVAESEGRWFEAIEPARLRPANLYQSQLRRRLGR